MDLKTISDALENLVTLKIRTVVGTYTEVDGRIHAEENARSIVSQIDLLGGDITTIMHDDFLIAPLNEVMQFHCERELKGQDIIQGNIRALKELVGLIATLARQQDETPALHADNKESAVG
ncbi:hypothetical protein [Beggiatoa leptomitoformis]|uniref:Uncharacterized protein n=1 Tax=Beggiatoa leptomitoformis TaxID=288004 RepID=A0A2N9YBN4_9GAMM|nr:hypothetical protein [Beggiatoa leptomitoformis]ALG66809.1 hypothetical protein AL038_02620 [Beggiatoa leptomitoformis]AUI67842.1 hypothetical protein BLE401_03425 [Beggiatoa leptomitoformis]